MRNSTHKEVMREAAACGRMKPRLTAQQLCDELYNAVSLSLSDAWVSDEAGNVTPEEYLAFVDHHLLALEEARGIFKKFLRRHRPRRR